MRYLVAVLYLVVLVGKIITLAPFNMFVAGAMIGVGYMVAHQWWFDRKLNREIMEEINALTKHYDNQPRLFPWGPTDSFNTFPENNNNNNNNTEVTRND